MKFNTFIEFILDKFKLLVSTREYFFILAAITFIAFCWPFFIVISKVTMGTIFIYFYLPWLILIVVLLITSLFLKN